MLPKWNKFHHQNNICEKCILFLVLYALLDWNVAVKRMGKLPAEAFDYIETIREQRIFIDVTEQEIKGKKEEYIHPNGQTRMHRPELSMEIEMDGRKKQQLQS